MDDLVRYHGRAVGDPGSNLLGHIKPLDWKKNSFALTSSQSHRKPHFLWLHMPESGNGNATFFHCIAVHRSSSHLLVAKLFWGEKRLQGKVYQNNSSNSYDSNNSDRSVRSYLFLPLMLWRTFTNKRNCGAESMNWCRFHSFYGPKLFSQPLLKHPDAQGILQYCCPTPGGFSATRERLDRASSALALSWWAWHIRFG